MKWTENTIARAIARQTFGMKHLVMVPNCTWTGDECDLLVLTNNLRIIDVEVKISRGDLKADPKKEKWWDNEGYGGYRTGDDGRREYVPPPRKPRRWPRKVWKHYYALPAEIWTPSLADTLPPASGILLLAEQKPEPSARRPMAPIVVRLERQAKPNRDAETLTASAVVDLARLASYRLWDAYAKLEEQAAAKEAA